MVVLNRNLRHAHHIIELALSTVAQSKDSRRPRFSWPTVGLCTKKGTVPLQIAATAFITRNPKGTVPFFVQSPTVASELEFDALVLCQFWN